MPTAGLERISPAAATWRNGCVRSIGPMQPFSWTLVYAKHSAFYAESVVGQRYVQISGPNRQPVRGPLNGQTRALADDLRNTGGRRPVVDRGD